MTPLETAAIAIGAVVAAAGLALAFIHRHDERTSHVRGTGDHDHAERGVFKAPGVAVETKAFEADVREEPTRATVREPEPAPIPELPALDPPPSAAPPPKSVKTQGKVHGSKRHRQEGRA